MKVDDTPRAIPTRYAGCFFRSRLEARWAVFFDHLGIEWEYEPEGYMCSYRLSDWSSERIWYLPDFWLPEHELHVEVKATLNHSELTRLLDCAASLSSRNGGGCHDNGGHDLLVCGKIPRPKSGWTHTPTRLHMHKGDLLATQWVVAPLPIPCLGTPLASDNGEVRHPPGALADLLTHGSPTSDGPTVRRLTPAYAAARGARFEHGHSGAA